MEKVFYQVRWYESESRLEEALNNMPRGSKVVSVMYTPEDGGDGNAGYTLVKSRIVEVDEDGMLCEVEIGRKDDLHCCDGCDSI